MGHQLYLLLAAVYYCFSLVNGYPQYQSLIPNGQRVPSPCDASKVWMGVGHQHQMGGGPRNPFGLDFKLHNLVRAHHGRRRWGDGGGHVSPKIRETIFFPGKYHVKFVHFVNFSFHTTYIFGQNVLPTDQSSYAYERAAL